MWRPEQPPQRGQEGQSGSRRVTDEGSGGVSIRPKANFFSALTIRTRALSPGRRPGTNTGIPSWRQTPSRSAPSRSAVIGKQSFFFIRLFKQEFGLSPVQYINLKKVERAQLLLYTTDCSVKEVAYKLGFSDHSYFIRLFHKVAGITPQEYRRQLRL